MTDDITIKKERPTIDDVAYLLIKEGVKFYSYDLGTNLLIQCPLGHNHKNNDRHPSLYVWEGDPVKKNICLKCYICEHKDIKSWFVKRLPNLFRVGSNKKYNRYSIKRGISKVNSHDLMREIGKKNRHEYI